MRAKQWVDEREVYVMCVSCGGAAHDRDKFAGSHLCRTRYVGLLNVLSMIHAAATRRKGMNDLSEATAPRLYSWLPSSSA